MNPADIDALIAELLAASEESGEVTLDAIGAAIGARAASYDEIDALFTGLEKNGRRVVAPAGGDGERKLQRVVTAARALVTVLGRTPTPTEIASHAGLPLPDVRHALALARTMQKPGVVRRPSNG